MLLASFFHLRVIELKLSMSILVQFYKLIFIYSRIITVDK